MKKQEIKKYIIYATLVAAGLVIGWFLFSNDNQPGTNETKVTEESKATIWTCSMHPQIRQDHPGDCPICGMDLIPLNQLNSDSTITDPAAIHLSAEAAQLANVMTSVVSRQKPVKEVRLYGKIQADERLLQSQTAHIPGRVEKLLVNFTGEQVRRGQPLAEIYSPELVTAEQELLEAAKIKDLQPEIYQASRERLLQWKIPEEQVNAIEKTGKVRTTFPIVANTSGIVTARRVNSGDHIVQGTVLYDIADLSSVWAMFDAYESDLPFLTEGDKITFTVKALPGDEFSGKIDFIDPVIDPSTRVAKVRLEINNRDGKLKPEMFVTGTLEADLKQYSNNLVIPRSAVLWTGKRSIVYVKIPGTDEPVFKMREIITGPSLGNSYVVLSGLEDGEEIVTNGTFNVDAAAQLEGKPSMMNTVGGSTPVGHDHGSVKNDNLKDGSDNNASDHSEHDGLSAQESAVNKVKLTGLSFKVSGNCDMCKERIESAAKSVKGVSKATWDQSTKMLQVTFDEKSAGIDQIQKAVANAGHDTEKYKADDKTYEGLPGCCKYRS